MRSNGLTAAAYTPVADLDPRVANALLDELKDQGIAAYTNPIESTSAAGFDRPEFRVDVKERLYVDAAAAARARDLIGGEDPTLIDDNDDLTWAQIVAGFDQPISSDSNPWPEDEDIDPAAEETAPPGAEAGPGSTYDDQDASKGSDHATAKVRAPKADDERFVPDPPPPLPRLEPVKQAAWIGVIGGPLLLLLSALFTTALPDWLLLIGVVGFIGGFVTLVATMSDDDDIDRGSDGGAVV